MCGFTQIGDHVVFIHKFSLGLALLFTQFIKSIQSPRVLRSRPLFLLKLRIYFPLHLGCFQPQQTHIKISFDLQLMNRLLLQLNAFGIKFDSLIAHIFLPAPAISFFQSTLGPYSFILIDNDNLFVLSIILPSVASNPIVFTDHDLAIDLKGVLSITYQLITCHYPL